MSIENMLNTLPKQQLKKAREFKDRLLAYANPVEFVNNMYGCHPDSSGTDYFKAIYKK